LHAKKEKNKLSEKNEWREPTKRGVEKVSEGASEGVDRAWRMTRNYYKKKDVVDVAEGCQKKRYPLLLM
jgi:hypothetical protein